MAKITKEKFKTKHNVFDDFTKLFKDADLGVAFDGPVPRANGFGGLHLINHALRDARVGLEA